MAGSLSVAAIGDTVLEPLVHSELKMMLFGQFFEN